MVAIDENQLSSGIRAKLQQRGFEPLPNSPYDIFFTRDSSPFANVPKTYFIFTKLEDCASAEALGTAVKAAKDYVASLPKRKHCVLYIVGLLGEVPQGLAESLSRRVGINLRMEIAPVLIERPTGRWFVAGQDYVGLPYDQYKFVVQEVLDLVVSVLAPDFLALPHMEEILLDVRLAPDDKRRGIVKEKYKDHRALLFSICNLQAIRGEEIGPSFDIRHALAVNYLKQALVDEISPVRAGSAFELGYTSGSRDILYRQLQDQRINWLEAGDVRALAYCRDCKRIVEPGPMTMGILDTNRKVGCPHSEKHKKLRDLVFLMPDESEKLTSALAAKHP